MLALLPPLAPALLGLPVAQVVLALLAAAVPVAAAVLVALSL